MSSELLRRYRDDVAQGRRKPDEAQERAVLALNRVATELMRHSPPSWLSRLIGKRSGPIKGLYCWGGVGRGKTYLMDLFFDTLPFGEKQRLHFHRFMYWLHGEMRQRKGQADPVRQVIAELAQTTRVLCFDEFFVSDIGDAMLLAATLDAMFSHGITLVTTSNIPPAELYRNGLQRDNFLPAIALLQQHCEILEVDGGVDYRLRELQQHGVYLTPDDAHAEQVLKDHFHRLCNSEHFATPLTIHDRAIHTRHWGEGVAWFDFSALCMGPRSQADYIELSKTFHTVLLSHVPQLNASLDDAARRFIALVDEFYERHVKLIISCDVPLEHIYVGEQLAFPYARTRSRLQEMQTETYLRKAHLHLKKRTTPLPMRNGVSPSYIWLSQPGWETVLDFLCERFPSISRQVWLERMVAGDVCNQHGDKISEHTAYQIGLCIFYYRDLPNEIVSAIPLDIIFHDEQLIVVDKPHGMPVIPTGRYVQFCVLTQLKAHLKNDRITPIHRLDRDTAGLVMFSSNPETRSRYQPLFEQQAVTKVYEAIAANAEHIPFPVTVRSRIERDEAFYKSREVEGVANSETYIEKIESSGEWARYRLTPRTGKKHQLRVHMAKLGVPIRFDPLYPEGCELPQPQSLQLVAKQLRFVDPIDQNLRLFTSHQHLVL